jgi:hypothetical protein
MKACDEEDASLRWPTVLNVRRRIHSIDNASTLQIIISVAPTSADAAGICACFMERPSARASLCLHPDQVGELGVITGRPAAFQAAMPPPM